nr:hypothetical protein [Rhodococcus sp. 06-418-1B]
MIQDHREALTNVSKSDMMKAMRPTPGTSVDGAADRAALEQSAARTKYVNSALADQRSKAAKELDAILADVTAQSQAAKDRVSKTRAKLSDTSDDVSAQLKRERYWRQTERLLSGQTPTLAAHKAQSLFKAATPEQKAVLLDELPSFLNSVDAPQSWIEGAARESFPDYADALADQKIIEKQAAITSANVNRARKSLEANDLREIANDTAFVDPTPYEVPTSQDQARADQIEAFKQELLGG